MAKSMAGKKIAKRKRVRRRTAMKTPVKKPEEKMPARQAGKKGPSVEEAKTLRERFVQEYLVDLNATQAAIRAGYSKKTARAPGVAPVEGC